MLLVIETATAAMSLALIADGVGVAAHHEVVGRGHAEKLLPAIAALLGNLRPDAIAVDCGPGSFTGVRVGLAAAQGLRIAWGIPTHGYSSTALVAAGLVDVQVDAQPGMQPVMQAVALTGGHGEVFVQTFSTHPLRVATPLRSLVPQAAAREIMDATIAGSGAAAVVAARGWGEAIDVLPRAADFVHLPRDLATLPLAPIYGRAPDAKTPAQMSSRTSA